MNTDPLGRIRLALIDTPEEFLIRVDGVDENGINARYLKELLQTDPGTWPPILVRPREVQQPAPPAPPGTLALQPPPVVRYDLVDGYHRLTAARQLGLEAIPAVCGSGITREEAFRLNASHGLHLTTKDRKEHARWLHDQFPELPAREIARRCGLAPNTVIAALSEPDSLPGEQAGGASAPGPSREKIARRFLGFIGKLWDTRGVLARFSEDRAISEIATALREQAAEDEEAAAALRRLRAVVNAATAKGG